MFGFACAGLSSASEPGEFLSDQLIAFVSIDGSQLVLLGLFFKVICVITVKILHRPAIDLKDAIRDAIEKVPVMRHEQQHAGVTREIRFEPLDRVGVKVIGRFVEDQNVRFEDEFVG